MKEIVIRSSEDYRVLDISENIRRCYYARNAKPKREFMLQEISGTMW